MGNGKTPNRRTEMIIDDIIETIQSDHPVKDVRLCIKATLVLSRGLGMAYNLRHHACAGRDVKDAGGLHKKSALELAKYAYSNDVIEASIGIAAINSLLEIPKDAVPLKGQELIYRKAAGNHVAMVGHFNFTEKLRKISRHLDVLELRPQHGDLPAEMAEEIIPQADVVIITGSTLVNHTLDHLLKLANGAYTILLGPTTPVTKVLFNYGIDAVCGIRVKSENVLELINFISQGGSFRNLAAVEYVTIFNHSN